MQVGILVDLYSVLLLSIDGYKTFEHLEDSTFPWTKSNVGVIFLINHWLFQQKTVS